MIKLTISRLNQRISIVNVLADTNFVIRIFEDKKVVGIIKRYFHGRSIRIILPKFVLREARKVKGYSDEEVLSRISQIFHRKPSVVAFNQDIQSSAVILEKKHPLAHFPDSMLLACAKICAYPIFTYDLGMVAVAKSEGIKVIAPKRGSKN